MTWFPRAISVLTLTATLVACGAGDAERAGERRTEAESAASAPSALEEAKPARTNLILITVDTLRADALGVYGQSKVVTPHIDAFANESVLFEDCVSSSPSTLPSHASIFTARHPYAHGVRSNSGYALGESELTLAEVLGRHGYRTRAEIASEVLAAKTRIGQGFESFHSVEADDVELLEVRFHADDQPEQLGRLRARAGADITRHGIRFLESVASGEDPFFLWLHYFDPHEPNTPPERFKARLPNDVYLAEVAYADHSIGDLLTGLIRMRLVDNTLVVITSDHGEGLGDHGEFTHASFLYDSTIRVPLIMRGPGLAKGKRIPSLVRTIDIAPTILDWLGLPPLDEPQGVSLRAVMNGSEASPLTAYGESIELLKAFGLPVLRFARQGRWKYIHSAPPELYDVSSDPAELDNAAEREPERTAELRSTLGELLRDASKDSRAAAPIDAATQSHLEALGYLVGSAPAPESLDTLELGDPPGGDSIAEDVVLLSKAKTDASYGFHETAVTRYRELRTRHPDSAELLRRLVRSLHANDSAAITSRTEVASLVEQVLEIDAGNSEILVQLGQLSARTGDIQGAASTLQLALEIEPCSSAPRGLLLNLLHTAKQHREHFEMARRGVLECPELPTALNDMAWIFATSTIDALRDGQQAVDLAERAVAAEPDNVAFRDTLAAAHAEVGDYERAQAILAELISELEAERVPAPLIGEFEAHLTAFAAGRPLRE